jgi:hypothetical protein
MHSACRCGVPQVNNMDYSAPGTQTDSTKARNPVSGTSDGNKPGSGGQKLAPRDGADIDPAGAPWSAMPEVRTIFVLSVDTGCSLLRAVRKL